MTPIRTLIAGCGYVGSALAEALCAHGHEVWGLRRDPSALPAGVRPLRADLRRMETLVALPEAVDYVIYAAAPGRSADPDSVQTAREIFLDGLELLLRALLDQGERPRRVILLSSTSVYGQRRGEVVDESSPTLPSASNGEILLGAERLLSASPLPSTILRLGGIYGPARTRLIDQVRAGEAVCREGSPQYTNRIHRDDIVGVIRHLMGLAEPESLYLGVDCEPSDEGEVLRWLAGQLGVAPPRGQVEGERLPSRRAGSKRCSNARLLGSGYRFRHPSYREGYAELLGLSGASR